MTCLALLLALAPAHAWPDAEDWIPLTQGGGEITDPQEDTVGLSAESAWDLVGDAENPAAFWSFDDENLYFRMRVNDDPSDTVPPYNGAWGFVVEYDDDTSDYEYAITLGGFAQFLMVQINSKGSGLNDIPDEVIFYYSDIILEDYARFTAVGIGSFGISSDYHIDIRISLDDVEKYWFWFSDNKEIRAGIGTSQDSDYTSLDSDGAGHDDTMGFGLLEDYLSDAIAIDGDGDGLDYLEEREAGTNPDLTDTDMDGLTDYDEVIVHGTDPLEPDSDGDGLTDYDELFKHGTNPRDTDSDDDGLTDFDEVTKHGTDPLDADSDDDTLSDYEEVVVHGTDPMATDSDGDGITDDLEVACAKGGTSDDRDGDGFSDEEEGLVDTDGDKKPDFCDQDSDGDGRPDADEGDGDDDCDDIPNRVDDDDSDGTCPDDTAPPVDTHDTECENCLRPGHLTGGCAGCGSSGLSPSGLCSILLALAALIRRR